MHNDQTTSALLKTEFQKFKIKLSHDHVNRLIRHHILKFWKILLTTKYMHVCTKLYTVYIRSQYIKSPYILRWLNHIQQKMKCIEKYKLVSPETEFAHTHSLTQWSVHQLVVEATPKSSIWPCQQLLEALFSWSWPLLFRFSKTVNLLYSFGWLNTQSQTNHNSF